MPKTKDDPAAIAAERAEADAEFRETVQKAADKRAKRLAKLPAGANVAEQAWNETKDELDPLYNAVTPDHKFKLDTAVDHIRRTGSADIAGLEAFEARVKELIADEEPTAALQPASSAGKEEASQNAEDTTNTAKRGALPDDFPHRQALADAGYDTYGKLRGLKGDYSGVAGIGEARGKEIDAALAD